MKRARHSPVLSHWCASILVVFGLAFRASLAAAQVLGTATIQGTVTDESGGVLPGVTVTATSPALQVPVLTTVSMEDGTYRFSEVPVGTYRLQYQLSGFQTVIREGIVLPVGFVARVNSSLRIGTLEESVIVSGQSPIIDTTTTTPAQNFTGETLALLPSTRSQYEILAMTPGIAMTGTSVDVGGSQYGTQRTYKNFGTTGQVAPEIEGINFRQDANASGIFLDYYTFQEFQVQAAGMGSEVALQGTVWSGIVKSGGNEFHGSLIGAYQPGSLQADNIDADLRARGVTGPGNKLVRIYDVFGDIGGRAIRDKLWFYGAWRQNDRHQHVGNLFEDSVLVPGVGLQGNGISPVDKHPIGNQTLKVTYQAAQRYKLIGFYMRNSEVLYSLSAENQQANPPFVPYKSGNNLHYIPWQAKFEVQGTPNDQVVFHLQLGYNYFDAIFKAEPGTDVAGNPSQRDLSTGWLHGPMPSLRNDLFRRRFQPSGNLTYVPVGKFLGKHSVKTGFFIDLFRGGRPSAGKCNSFETATPDAPYCSGNYQLLFNRIGGQAFQPFQINVYNAPTPGQHVRMRNYSGYVKDDWQIGRRLNLNLGVRVESYANYVIASDKPAGQFSSAATFDGVDVRTWVSAAPRLGLAYDPTGKGKTVVKSTWGWYNWTMGDQNFSANFDRNAETITTYRWNGPCQVTAYTTCDFVPGSVDLRPTSAAFVTQTAPGNAILNPALRQPRTYELTASLERELAEQFSVRALYVYRKQKGLFMLVNPARPYEAYNVSFTVRDPGPDGAAGTADDGQTLTLYDVNPAYNGVLFIKNQYQNTQDSNSSNFQTLNVEFNKRMGKRLGLLTAFTLLKNHRWLIGADNAGVVQSPNDLINTIDKTWERHAKVEIIYHLPYGLTFAAFDQIQQGFGRQRTFLFTGLPVLSSATVRMEPYGQTRFETLQLLNISLQKQLEILKKRRLTLRVDLYNALNVNAATGINQTAGPNFDRVTAFVPPRVARVGIELRF